MEWSWTTWWISVAAVLVSAILAWIQNTFAKRPGLDMGFVNHGGMWGDLALLPIANAVIVPHLQPGPWIAASLLLCAGLSAWVHVHWYRGDPPSLKLRRASPPSHREMADDASARLRQATTHSREHMWPSRPHGSWWKDLSWAGWAHMVYVAGQLTISIGFLLFPMPDLVVVAVSVIFTLHVPLGLLQPRWFLTGEIASPRKQPLVLPLLATLWIVGLVKL